MAKVKITGHASGTGILTVTAPNTSTDRTITLPDATGTLLNSDGSAASLTAIPAANITGTLPAISGANLTGFTASQMPAGSILQVLMQNYTSSTTIGTGTYTDTGLTIDITPSATSSKIFVLVSLHSSENTLGNDDRGYGIKILRDSTNIFESATLYNSYTRTDNGLIIVGKNMIFQALDSPSSTSALTYKVQAGTYSGDDVVFHSASNDSQITVMEVAG